MEMNNTTNGTHTNNTFIVHTTVREERQACDRNQVPLLNSMHALTVLIKGKHIIITVEISVTYSPQHTSSIH